MNRSIFLCIAFCCTVALPPAYAQQDNHVVSLADILQKSLGYAPGLLADSAAVRIKDAQLAAVQYNWLPSVKLNYQADLGTNNNLPGGYFSYGIVPSNSKVRTDGNASTILTDLGIASLDWEIYNFGAYSAQQKVAASDLQVEQLHFEQSKYDLQYNIVGYYLQLTRLHDLLNIQYQNILRNTEIKRTIRALAVSGIKAGVDTSIAEAELSKARLIYLELNNQFRHMQQQLSYLSGMTANDLFPDSLFEDHIISSYQKLIVLPTDTAHHPVINLYNALYQNSLNKETLIKKSYLPKVSLEAAAWGRGSSVSASDEFRNLGKGFGFERGNYLVGVGVTYNIIDLKKSKLQLRTQQANTTYNQKRLQEQQALLSASVNQADIELSTADDRLKEIPQQLNAANAAYRQKLSLYKNGLTDIIELNAALSVLYRAETDYTNAKYLFCKAVFEKAIATNQLSFLINSLK
jgi:outer membrane protein, adhesin transport system